MSEPLTLTFAEIEFVLTARPQQAAEVRRDLRIDRALGVVGTDLARAGLASLLARELCVPGDVPAGDSDIDSSGDSAGDSAGGSAVAATTVKPGPEITAVAAGLSTSRTHTLVAGWHGKQADVMHLYSGDSICLAVFPYQFGRFAMQALDPAEPLSGPLTRFLEAHLESGVETAFVASSTTDGVTVSIAVAVDASGTWSVSDTKRDPDRARPSTRAEVLPRIAELFDGGSEGPAA